MDREWGDGTLNGREKGGVRAFVSSAAVLLVPLLLVPLLLVPLLLVACASARDPEPAADGDAVAASSRCYQSATVVVRVDNQSSYNVVIGFGAYNPVRPVLGFTRTTFNVPRTRLRGPIRLEIVGGGLQVGGPARVMTEPVVCDVATLIIGPVPRYSFFYGDGLGGDDWEDADDSGPASDEPSEGPPDKPSEEPSQKPSEEPSEAP